MTMPTNVRPGRNEPCPCGSGRKYKHCCLAKDEEKAAAARAAAQAASETAPASPDEAPAPAPRVPQPKTDQPWKTGSSTRGFVPRPRTPRKVGGG